MLNFFNITDEQFFDKNKIKVINGIAGSAKSSNVDKIFKEHGVKYGRYTSTNRLKRDAEDRYGGNNDTIAGGLFNTNNGVFFFSEKEPEYDNVVIDEILQTSTKVFEWCLHNVGNVNIIIMTDNKQTLTPVYGVKMSEYFDNFIKNDNVLYIELNKTYRARTEETERIYYEAYKAVDTDYSYFRTIEASLPHIDYKDMVYNNNDVFICHTREIEAKLFNDYDIQNDYAAELIPKGTISRKAPKDISRYPILPQKKVLGKTIAYAQPENVGTVTRYQGSEVTDKQKLYYIIEDNSVISNREFYTVITRLYNINSLIIVTMKKKEHAQLVSYNKKPVKSRIYGNVKEDYVFKDGRKMSDIIKENNSPVIELNEDDIYEIYREIRKEQPLIEERCFMCGKYMIRIKPSDKTTRTTMPSLLKKEPEFDYNFMEEFFQIMEKRQRTRYSGSPVETDRIIQPRLLPQQLVSYFEDENEEIENKSRNDYEYGIDLKSAYPHILKYAKLPVDGELYQEYDENKINFFMCILSKHFEYGTICTDAVVNYLSDDPEEYFIYLCSAKCKTGSRMGDWLFEQCNKDVESKRKIKDIHYGLLEKPFLQVGETSENGNVLSYFIDRYGNKQLLMVAILSELSVIMMKIRSEIYGNLHEGVTNVDCLYFDYEEDIKELGDKIKESVMPYNFRIFKNDENKEVLYKTYEELKTKQEIKNEKRREKRRQTKK